MRMSGTTKNKGSNSKKEAVGSSAGGEGEQESNNHNAEKGSRNPQEPLSVVNDPAAFDAASEVISDCIASNGSIDAAHCMRIIERKSSIARLIRSRFPGSEGSSYAVKKAITVIESHGLTPDNTLFAQSICPDEINHEEGDLPNIFAEYFGKVFHMGGLAGIPFTGSTGFAAFAHHVPDDGHCFVLVAPHVSLHSHSHITFTSSPVPQVGGGGIAIVVRPASPYFCFKILVLLASDRIIRRGYAGSVLERWSVDAGISVRGRCGGSCPLLQRQADPGPYIEQ